MVSHNLDWFGITLPTKPINKVEVCRKWVKIGKCHFWEKKAALCLISQNN